MRNVNKGSITIRDYKPDDHAEVRSIFNDGIYTNIWPAFQSNWNGDKTDSLFVQLSQLTFCFLIAFLHSPWAGFFGFIGYQAFQYFLLRKVYTDYARDHLDTDLNDVELTFWTKPPHFFLVATYNSNNESDNNNDVVVGMVAIQSNEESVAELNRLSVHSPIRGLGIGSTLVDAALKRCKSLGFKSVYLETASCSGPAVNIYKRAGFEHIGSYNHDIKLFNFAVPRLFHFFSVNKYIHVM